MAEKMMLLQMQVTGTFDTVSVGTWVIGLLLSLIAGLLIYIWQDNKAQSNNKHLDIVALITRLDTRQTALEEEQKAQKFQIVALNGAINGIQGKPFNYDNTTLSQ